MQFLILCVHVLILRDGSRRRTLDRGMSEGPAQMKWLHTRCESDCVGYNYLQRSLVEVKVGESFLLIMCLIPTQGSPLRVSTLHITARTLDVVGWSGTLANLWSATILTA